MVTVHREAGMRFVIFSDDHEPAHVHVSADGTAKINLRGRGGEPELVRSHGMSAGDLRKAMRIVAEQQNNLIKRWSELHG
ncbi:MAG: hypothetical protein RLY97_1809 [Pseudomonadota bacterium]